MFLGVLCEKTVIFFKTLSRSIKDLKKKTPSTTRKRKEVLPTTTNAQADHSHELPSALILPGITRVHSNRDQIWLEKIGENIGFYFDRRP